MHSLPQQLSKHHSVCQPAQNRLNQAPASVLCKPGVCTQPAMALQPLFISGSTHKELVAGQEVRPAALVLAEVAEKRTARGLRKANAIKGSGRTPPKRAPRSHSHTLKQLIGGGWLKPGKDNVTLIYKGAVLQASLTQDGQIEFQGSHFGSPDDFSVYARDLIAPQDVEADGWRDVHVDGVSLEDYRQKLVQSNSQGGAGQSVFKFSCEPYGPSIYEQQLAPGAQPPLPSVNDQLLPEQPEPVFVPEPLPAPKAKAVAKSSSAATSKAAKAAAAAAAAEAEGDDEGEEGDTSNWVQCTRCQTWRVVPDDFWPDIEAAGDEDWYCEEATWDITQFDPFSKGCKAFAATRAS